MGRRASCCFFIVAAFIAIHSCNGNMFDPCSGIGSAVRGDAFPVGLALIPGGNVTQLQQLLVENGNIQGMCNQTLQTFLINTYNARIAVFNLRLDRLQVMRLPYPDIIFSIANAANATMTAILFRNNVASVPAYLANGSNDTSIHGAGFVVSLAAIMNYDRGILSNIYWYDLTCNACGGKTSQICIQQLDVNSCATPFTNCTCIDQGANCSYADAQFNKCSTSINVGFSGTDANDAAFRTGSQVKRLNAFSLTSLFYSVKDTITSGYNNIYSNINGNWGQLQQDSKNQQLDFGSSIGGGGGGGSGGGTPPPSPDPNIVFPPPNPPPPPPNPLPPGFGG